MANVGVLRCSRLAVVAISALSFGRSAVAASRDRACLLQQASQFNSSMLAHTTGKIPLGHGAEIRENTKAISLDASKWSSVKQIRSEGVYADPVLGNVIEHVAAETDAGKIVYIGTRLKVANSKITEVEINIDVPLTAAEMPGPDIDLVGEMKRSGLSAICMTFATDYQPGNAYDRFLKGLASMDRQLERNGMKRSLTLPDVRTAHENKQPMVIQAVEGGHFLQGHIERVEEAYNRGCGTLGCFTTVTPPCHWAMFTPTLRAMAD